MTFDPMKILSSWDARSESRDGCREKIRKLLSGLRDISSRFDDWVGQNYALKNFEDSELDRVVYQSKTDERPPRAMPQMGYHCNLVSKRSHAYLSMTCGAWSSTSGNRLNIESIPDSVIGNPVESRAIFDLIVQLFDPQLYACVSTSASRRFGRSNERHPIIDWMLYAANCVIPPEALPMVHSVERVGSGTLVILKKERLHLDRPEDLALLEAAEPIIRSYLPPPPPKPNQPAPRTLQ